MAVKKSGRRRVRTFPWHQNIYHFGRKVRLDRPPERHGDAMRSYGEGNILFRVINKGKGRAPWVEVLGLHVATDYHHPDRLRKSRGNRASLLEDDLHRGMFIPRMGGTIVFKPLTGEQKARAQARILESIRARKLRKNPDISEFGGLLAQGWRALT